MILKRLQISTWIGDPTNCYIIFDEETKETMVIDPAGDVNRIVETVNILNGKLKYIYITHCHGDHIEGVRELKEKLGGKIIIHTIDAIGLNDASINLTQIIDMPEIELEADSRLSLYLESEKLVFTGDTLFRGTWGRTDLPTSDFKDIIDSITNKLMKLPDDTICYPGHRKVNYDWRRKTYIFRIKTKRILNKYNKIYFFITVFCL